ncbi:MAG: hypothetical protein IJS05_06450 [Paludibacteraceae bacterium]|nr:hypothetical protein [Paludibacteraceae bacterium]
MAYTRRYLLNRIKAVCEIYLREAKRGVNNEFIYDNYIRDQFHISRSTFYEYLTVPYERQLRELDRKEAEEKRQNPTLDFGE